MTSYLGQIVVPIYDAPYNISPSPNPGANAIFTSTTLEPVVSSFGSAQFRAPMGNTWGDPASLTLNCKALWLPTFCQLFANSYVGYNGGTQSLRYRITCPPLFFGNQVLGAQNNGAVNTEDIPLLQYWNQALNGVAGAVNNIGLIQGTNFIDGTNDQYPMGENFWNFYASTMILPGPQVQASVDVYTCLFTYYAGFTSAALNCFVTFSYNQQSRQYVCAGPWPIDKSNTFNASYESIVGGFYNFSIKNNYQGAVCTPDGKYNSFITLYQAGATAPVNLNFYSADPKSGGNFLTSIPNTSTNPFPGVPLGWRIPDAMCNLGYLWVSNVAGHATILTPDGSGYYDLLLEPQSASAAIALSAGSPDPSGLGVAIMGDTGGNIWVISNKVNSGYLYVGNGLSNVLTLLPPKTLEIPYPVALPCFNPCSPNFPMFGKL